MRCRRDREHAPHSWGVEGENDCPGVPASPKYLPDTLEKLMFRVALLRDLTALSDRDRRALDAAYKNLDGVRRRAEGAS